MSVICENCNAFKTHGRKCWFYWESKKACSQYQKDAKDEPHYEEVKPLAIKIS